MTIAELMREIESKKRVNKFHEQQTAINNYILADLIGRSIARLYSSSNKLPTIDEVYPQLFNKEEIEEQQAEKRTELSIIRFKQFVSSYNHRKKGGSKVE